jgi:hypothetical protein
MNTNVVPSELCLPWLKTIYKNTLLNYIFTLIYKAYGRLSIQLDHFQHRSSVIGCPSPKGPGKKILPLACPMARLLRSIHSHVSPRHVQVDVSCRQTTIRRNRMDFFLTVILKSHSRKFSAGFFLFQRVCDVLNETHGGHDSPKCTI